MKAFWSVQREVSDFYDFGLIKFDCRPLKKAALKSIEKLQTDFREHLLAGFKQSIYEESARNREIMGVIKAVHTDIDKTIAQIGYIQQLQSDDVTEEIILVVKKLTQRKAFLDRLAIPVESVDFQDYLELY